MRNLYLLGAIKKKKKNLKGNNKLGKVAKGLYLLI